MKPFKQRDFSKQVRRAIHRRPDVWRIYCNDEAPAFLQKEALRELLNYVFRKAVSPSATWWLVTTDGKQRRDAAMARFQELRTMTPLLQLAELT